MLKLEDNPPMCPPDVENVSALQGDWWVVHTKSRFEKALAFDLLASSIGFYLPMVQRITMSGGRKRRAMMPLFPSYVFLCGSEEDRYTTLTTNRVCQVIPVVDREKFVSEISAIEQALGRNGYLEMCPLPPVGKRCRVKAGPFMGIEGTVVQHGQRSLIVLHISILGRGASLEIDTDLIETVE